jgi:hypothetical protein
MNLYPALILLLSLSLFACDKNVQEHSHSGSEDSHTHAKEAPTVAKPAQAIAQAEIKHEPSVPMAEIPNGRWYCNMNDMAHYSRADKGDGKCPVCSMNLMQRGSEPVDEKADEHGHAG